MPKNMGWADYAGGIGMVPAKSMEIMATMADMAMHPNKASKPRMTHSVLLGTVGSLGLLGGDINNINSYVSRPIEKEATKKSHHKDPRSLH